MLWMLLTLRTRVSKLSTIKSFFTIFIMFNFRYRLQNATMIEVDDIIDRYREYLPLEKVTCVPQSEHFDDNAVHHVTCTLCL